MKPLRLADFDPNAKPPTLGSPMDSLPIIQKPKLSGNAHVTSEAGTFPLVENSQGSKAQKSENPKISPKVKLGSGSSVSKGLVGLPSETVMMGQQSNKSKTMSMITRLNSLTSPVPQVERTNERVAKYSTWLEPGLEEEIEFCAFANDVRKYDVVIAAIKQFLKIK